MSFQTSDFDDDDQVMSEINMTPLVDVMLVLLIIFIITVPVINHAVKLDLPRASSQPNDVRPAHINLSVDAQGQTWWNDSKIAESELDPRLSESARQTPQPEIHLRADGKVAYEKVAQLLASLHRAGLGKIAFASDPKQ